MRVVVTLMLVLGGLFQPATAETINIYSYHNHPPFVTGPSQGLTYELAAILQQQAGERYDFKVKILPRPRLNATLKHWISGQCAQQKCAENWIVPWVNPKWGFIKGPRDNYFWHRLFGDSSSIISHSKHPIDYQGPESLKGKTIAGIRGQIYIGVDELVKTGQINRINGNHELDNLKKLLAFRVDATVLPTSAIVYMRNHDPLIMQHRDKLIISDKKQQTFNRYIMLPETRRDLLQFVSQTQESTDKILDAYR